MGLFVRRAIFRYWDGRTRLGIRFRRKADPLRLWRELWTDEACNLERDFPDAVDGELDAMARVVTLARNVFKLKTVEKGGLTDMEALTLLADFLEYMAALKKNTDPTPMPSPPTESVFSEESPTSVPWDSSSTDQEPNGEDPSESSKPECPCSQAS